MFLKLEHPRSMNTRSRSNRFYRIIALAFGYHTQNERASARIGLSRKALTVCHRVHREVREEPSCFREDRRVAEEAVLRDIHSRLGDNPARPHEVLRVDDVAADSVADKGRPPKPRPVVCWNSMVSDHRTRSCYHLSTIHSSSDPAKYFPSS